MSTTAASNTNDNEPLPPNNDGPQSPSSFFTLPKDIVLNILARVTRHKHPILSCVSKNIRSLVRSSELHKTRSLQGKDDSFYVCFRDFYSPFLFFHWFTLDQNRLVSIPFPSPPEPNSSALMIGHEIYLVGGCLNNLCRSMWILDSRSGKLRQGPNRLVARHFPAVGVVDKKIYIFGGYQEEHKEVQAEVFDTKTESWDVAPNPNVDLKCLSMSVVNRSLDGKIYVRNTAGQVIVYDPSDGKCEKIDIQMRATDVCVIDNVLYIWQYHGGLKWYDSTMIQWRVVKGLNLGYISSSRIVLAESNGKLVFLQECSTKKKTEICCAMVALERGPNALGIVGKVEWSDRILSVPLGYQIVHCVGRTD
ncbi:unnamed protein product [Microthlaspi erraticum]|uniref:F-box domain-containing protein n=1 Tax=Microthlaspi erraticum TaxID=1685480 RepID=A0A6D2HUD1_9BRAS|nr:unnamed protein product [Microthlaspi erraticum]